MTQTETSSAPRSPEGGETPDLAHPSAREATDCLAERLERMATELGGDGGVVLRNAARRLVALYFAGDSAAVSPDKPESAPARFAWRCVNCNTLNEADATRCTACGVERPAGAPTP